MICKKCGAQIDDAAKFCPSCGHSTADNVQPTDSQSFIPRWFKWLFGLAALLLGITTLLFFGSEDLTNTVEDQLRALRENRISEAYYNFTSKEFQDSTSLDKFKEFLKVFPALTENQSVRFIDRKSDDGVGMLDAVLMSKNGQEIKAQYRLVLDNESDKWKILSVKFEDLTPAQMPTQPLSKEDEESVKKVAENQLQKIQGKDLKKAYEEHASSDFKKSTSQKQFETFVNTQPGFFNHKSIRWDKGVTDGEIAVLIGSITTTDDKSIPVAFQLVKENGGWKILQIQVEADAKGENGEKSAVSKAMEFSQFVLGTTVDEEGVVIENRDTFPPDTKDIYLNLYIANGSNDAKINIELEHSDTKAKIPPVETKLQEDGHAILRIVFSPPPEGWPKGKYHVLATSSTGAKKTYDFKIE